LSPLTPSASALPPDLSPLDVLRGRTLLLIGTTGFVAKVVLGMLLERFSVRKLYCLVRSTGSKSAEDRFETEVLNSEMMVPIRQRFGGAFDLYVRNQVEPIAGDVSLPDLGIAADRLNALRQEIDVVVNSAGLVNFNPPLDAALDINVLGAVEVARFAQSLRSPKLVHISTCFVAGERSGRIREDEEILGFFPRKAEFPGIEFSWTREVSDLQRAIKQTRAETDDAALAARFQIDALKRLKQEHREPNDRTLRAAITHQRRRWVQEKLTRIGIERAKHWGWPNIYTFTKALGEQAIVDTQGLQWAMVRPSIVESALSYPFPGWNEGMNTTAPLAFLGLRGQKYYPGNHETILDVVPVDFVSSATIAATAQLLSSPESRVYQVATGDTNPTSVAECVNFLGLYKRRYAKRLHQQGKISSLQMRAMSVSEPITVSRQRYETTGTPMLQQLIQGTRRILEKMEPERYGPLAPTVAQARKTIQEQESKLEKVKETFELFMPFVWENRYIFSTKNTRALFDGMNEADRALLPFHPEALNWLDYWMDIHLPGLEKWVFPSLEEEGPKRAPIHRDYRDMGEFFESRTRNHARRVAFRTVREGQPVARIAYRDVHAAATDAARCFVQSGVKPGDRVLLVGENGPEWGVLYFSILLAGAAVVPLPADASPERILRIAKTVDARGLVLDETAAGRVAAAAGPEATPTVWSFESVLSARTTSEDATSLPKRKPDDLAVLAFDRTAAADSESLGVSLTDRNLTSLVARASTIFELCHNDSMLALTSPHRVPDHTLSLLLPFAEGASVTYLEHQSPELLNHAFLRTSVTGIVTDREHLAHLYGRLKPALARRGPVGSMLSTGLVQASVLLRQHTGLNPARWFWRTPHRLLGGRVRHILHVGPSVPPAWHQRLRGLGFSVYQGYGPLEAGGLAAIRRPGQTTDPRSVGWPLPGVEIRIDATESNTLGEILVRGSTVTPGYFGHAEATPLNDGWLHSGHLGRTDSQGRLFVAGRTTDRLASSGSSPVMLPELEAVYETMRELKALAIAAIPDETAHRVRLVALITPEEAFLQNARSFEALVRKAGQKLPPAHRIETGYIWYAPLPRDEGGFLRRDLVASMIQAIEEQRESLPNADLTSPSDVARDFVTKATERRDAETAPPTQEMHATLVASLLRRFPGARLSPIFFDPQKGLSALVHAIGEAPKASGVPLPSETNTPDALPNWLRTTGKRVLGWAQKTAYQEYFDVHVEGRGNIPANRNFIVATNHVSHLDMGLAKHALGDIGQDLVALAAKDYFFDDPLRRAYFENFTNLLPMDRHGSLKQSLKLASQALRAGQSLLIFPEGTRSPDGQMQPFKPAIGFLCLHENVDVLPMYLGGTHHALPKGKVRLRGRELFVRIGAPIRADALKKQAEGLPKADAYRAAAQQIEDAVRALGTERRPRKTAAAERAHREKTVRGSS
jgi:long-chain acyl-CoA synthetase